jgi:transcriptional regulator with XRE-family HTH domain
MSLKNIKSRLLSDKQYREKYNEKSESELAIRVGAKIQELRIFKGVTQADLAVKMQTQQPNIARIEAGKKLPSLKTLHKIAVAMDTHVIEPGFAVLNADEYSQINYLQAQVNRMEQIMTSILTQPARSTESKTFVWTTSTAHKNIQSPYIIST